MKVEIIETPDDKELYLDNTFIASWNKKVSDKVIYEAAVTEAFAIGEAQRAKDISRLLK